jgi:hypothetical protein
VSPQFALDESSTVVAAVECPERAASPRFTCPSCYGELAIAGGPRTEYIRHFRHENGTEACYEYPDRRGQNEHHAVATRTIADDLRAREWAEDITEDCRPDQRNPDVRFHCEGVEYAVEVQASTLSAEDVVERTQYYTDEGIHTFWLFHDSLYDDAPLDETHPEFLPAQQGWFSMLVEDGGSDVWVPLYGPTQATMGVLGNAWHLRLYSGMNAGRPERTTATNKPTPFIGRDGLLLAAGEQTVRSFGEIGDDSGESISAQEESSGSQRGLIGGLG